jgi:regulator of cell morphogenesis and NO signaling
MKIISPDILDLPVSEIVKSDYRTSDVFKRYGISYCCGGQISLNEACHSLGLKHDQVLGELEAATQNIILSNTLEFNSWPIGFLIDYITNVHHAYIYQALPSLEAGLLSFASGHRSKYPELDSVLEVFEQLSAVLASHNRHEEEIIFPYIKQIEIAYRRRESYGNLFVRTLRKPLSNIEHEHTKITGLLKNMRRLTNHYTFPSNACAQHQVIYRKLKEFDDDMVQHKHLENNILFPKAIEIEKELLRL